MAKKLTVYVQNIHSTQEWAQDPSLVEITLTDKLLARVERAVAAMKDIGLNDATIWYALPHELYTDAYDDDFDFDYEGERYVIFEPDYSLDGCHLKIHADGDLRFVCPFKHTADELFGDIGNLAKLQAQLAAQPDVPAEGAKG